MSLLNGISSLGAGINELAGNGLKDAESQVRIPLLNSGPAAPQEQPNVEAKDTPPDVAAPADVPSKLLPIYQAASKRTGIPIDVLIAQAKQESGFNPNAVGSAGEIGLHQIKPSTASDPGFGMRGIDPAMLKDAAVNINFAADYLKARAGDGVDFSNPKAVDAALAKYNGGGDPNYVQNVRRHMGAA